MRKVAIVNTGGYGDHSAEKGSYDSLVETLERTLKQARRSDQQPAADVSVTRSTEEALQWVGGYGTVVYVTRGMGRDAKKVAEEHPGVRVVIFTGAVPEREVFWFSKWWVSDTEQLEAVVLKG
ncbi:MAG: hypothetical protein HY474_02060 [Candidatus Sungbacteria bacterium]|uniref:Uncharacterized protein n=1 Tax=Candidatus Sungiibacteriota bacterium TaxID=2750080 RepID=A0A932YYN1_9BACT|nr:hypothetical protein [Candidatus Sungbacteria bacterium]